MYKLPVAFEGYEANTELRDVTLQEAQAMECNRCGDCCNGLNPHVKKDDTTGLPLFVWGSKFPVDLYEGRYGQRMLQPIGFLDDSSEMPYQGDIGIVDKFEEDENGKPHTCFQCSFHRQDTPESSTCLLRELHGDGDPNNISQIRPLNCGEFPVFSPAIGDALIGGHTFIPATGALPRCTWHGIRIVGPWKDEPYWRDRWEKQQHGEAVEDLSLPEEFIKGLEYKQSLRKGQK
jgi:hypothetical protein